MATNQRNVVLQQEHAVWQAVLDKDGDRLNQLLADDYLEVTLDGIRCSKRDVVQLSPQVDGIDSYAIDQEHIIPLDERCYLLNYHLELKGTLRGQLITPIDRWVSSIWTQAPEGWQCRLFQQSHYKARQRTND